MLKKILIGLIGFCSTNTFANELQDKQVIRKMMNQYINAVACSTNPIEIKDIASIFPPEQEYTGSTYYVLWSGDKGCEGGSATLSSYISEVSRYSISRPFLVTSDDALGDNNEESWKSENAFTNSRFIESMKKLDNGQLEFISSNYADVKYGGKDGGNNFPANKFRYILAFEDSGWKVVKQVLLEQNH